MVKTLEEINYIRESCRVVAGVLEYIEEYIMPGVTTLELDCLIEEYIKSNDGIPAFKGYKVRDNVYPANSCISVNEEVVHGIPGSRKLIEGDIVSIDVGVKKGGYYGDGATTFAVGKIADSKKKLMRVAEESLYIGLEYAKDGNFVNEVSYAVQQHVEAEGFSVVRDLVGHGIGRNLHEEPPVPNYYFSDNRYRFRAGMTVAIEPMVNYGTFRVKILPDKWTYVTADGEPSAHYEHSVLVTKDRPEILTALN